MKIMKYMPFLAAALSIVKANGWIIIPTSVIVLCWFLAICGWMCYCYAVSILDGVVEKLAETVSKEIARSTKSTTQEDIHGAD